MKSKKKKTKDAEHFDRRVASIIQTWKSTSGKTLGVTESRAPRTKKKDTKPKREEYHTFFSVKNKHHEFGRFQFQRNYRTQRFNINYTGPTFNHFAELDLEDFMHMIAYCLYASGENKRYLRLKEQ